MHVVCFHQWQTFYICFRIFSKLVDNRNQLCYVGSHGQASKDMDISMDIYAKSVDMDMAKNEKLLSVATLTISVAHPACNALQSRVHSTHRQSLRVC